MIHINHHRCVAETRAWPLPGPFWVWCSSGDHLLICCKFRLLRRDLIRRWYRKANFFLLMFKPGFNLDEISALTQANSQTVQGLRELASQPLLPHQQTPRDSPRWNLHSIILGQSIQPMCSFWETGPLSMVGGASIH